MTPEIRHQQVERFRAWRAAAAAPKVRERPVIKSRQRLALSNLIGAHRAAEKNLDRLALIFGQVADKHGLTIEMMLAHRRPRALAYARHEAYWRAYRETAATLPEIGRAYSRDHTSIMYGIAQHERRLLAVRSLV